MKRFRWLISILMVIGILFLIKYFFIQDKADDQKGGGPMKDMPIKVTAIKVTKKKSNGKLLLGGTARAFEEVNLMPELSGKVVGIYFKEGQPVKKGDLLVKLGDLELQAQKKKLNQQLELWSSKLKRQEELFKINGISKEEIELTKSTLNGFEADLELLQAQLTKTEIRAPFSGKIGLRNISEGAYVNAGSLITTLIQDELIKIDFSIPEKDAAKVKIGTDIYFNLPHSPAENSAKVYAMEHKLDNDTRTLSIRAVYKNDLRNKIIPGQFIRIKVDASVDSSALFIPTQSIVPVLKGKKVFVIIKGNAQERMILTSYRSDKEIEVTEGLQEGDTVIVGGVLNVKNGSKLKVTMLKP